MENIFAEIMENIAEVILVVDKEGRIIYASPSALRVFGIKAETLTGKKLWEIELLKDAKKMMDFFQKLKTGEMWKKREIIELDHMGNLIYCSIYATPLSDFQRFVLAIRDITPIITAQRKIDELNEILRVVNKMLRHDLINKLAIVRGFLELSLEKPEKEKVEKALKVTDEAFELINRMRELENTILTSELKLMDVREVAEKIAENFRNRGIEVNIRGEAKAFADDALYSVFDNLLSNAVKHGGAKRIEISIQKEGNYCKVIVEDFGKGLPEEVMNNLFREGFSYGDKAGSGLGLYIVKKVIERYGGQIRAYNRKGAVFEFLLRT
ncbi:MAG: PAS domain-containing sensor histidine kinase [Archaeoglobaceae archaeon]